MVSIKMERAKRLELLRSLLQSCLGEEAYQNLTKPDAQGGAHAENTPEIDPKLEAWVAEMEEVIAAWPNIEPAVRTGLMAIARSHHGASVRISAKSNGIGPKINPVNLIITMTPGVKSGDGELNGRPKKGVPRHRLPIAH